MIAKPFINSFSEKGLFFYYFCVGRGKFDNSKGVRKPTN